MEYYVELSKTPRKEFIEILKQKGFRISSAYTEKQIIDYGTPIIVDFNSKNIRLLNVTCAIWARVHGLILNEDRFMEVWNSFLHSLRNEVQK